MNKTFSFRDITGFYTDEGKGTPILLIHGFCEDGSVWDAFKRNLSKQFRVIAPDLPGCRNSMMTKEILTIEWMAEFVKAILDHEKISKPIVIGHSMGGYITLALAEKHPALPDKIGLFHSHCFADDEEKKKSRQNGIDYIHKNGTAGFVHELYNNLFAEKFIAKNKTMVSRLRTRAQSYPPETLIANLQAMMQRPDRGHVLKSFKKPVLFILGKQDKAIPYIKSLEQCGFPEIAEVHLLENAGHMGMLESPEETIRIVKEFANR